jgi:DNA-binding transcriptional MerR regulator
MPRTARTWTATAAARIAKVNGPTLRYWLRSGLFAPSNQTGTGEGRRYGFTFRDLVALKTVAGLRSQGVSLQRLRRVRAALNKRGELLERVKLVLVGDAVHLIEDDKFSDVLSGQLAHAALVFDVGQAYRAVREATATEARHQADVRQQRSAIAFKRWERAG